MTDTNNYYPFGLNHISGIFSTSGFGGYYSYKYNGKELQETGMFDYGARMYLPDLGRWGVIDPLAETSRRFTPYHYGNNNPIRFIDPDGRLTVDNLQGGYTRGSAVADFLQRTGLAGNEQNMPLFYRDEGGAMITTEAVGNDGQGGGDETKQGPKPGILKNIGNFIGRLFGRNNNKNKVEVGPAEQISEKQFSNEISAWQIVSALLFNSTDPYSAIGNMGVGDYAEERENVGMAAMIFINPEAAAEGLERKALSRGAMSKIWGAGPKRIDPQNLPKSVTEDWVEILAGRGVKQLDEFGVHAVTQNRSGISPKWVGSLEWKIKDVPGSVGLNSSRIVQHPDGKWGLVIDHDYTKIINLPTSSAVK